jgi:hypothetical protein
MKLALSRYVTYHNSMLNTSYPLLESKGLSTSNIIRPFLSNGVYRFNVGYRSSVETNGASVMRFGLPTGPILAASLSSTIVPEITALFTLFDEFKTVGISWSYNPTNPFNRGTTTNSAPIAFFWDDMDTSLTPTNSNAGMGLYAQRAPMWKEFSPDIPHKHSFERVTSIDLYDWTPKSNPGGEPSSFGGLYVIGDGTNTASTVYGYIEYQFLVEFRMRI